MNKEGIEIIKEQLPREELVENYKSISKLNKKYCKDNIELQQRIEKAIEYIENEIKDSRSKDNLWLMGCYDEDKKILEILRGEE